MLIPDTKEGNAITLRHLKARHSEAKDLDLVFDGPRQRFTSVEDNAEPDEDDGG
jgi:hypothetical protein